MAKRKKVDYITGEKEKAMFYGGGMPFIPSLPINIPVLPPAPLPVGPNPPGSAPGPTAEEMEAARPKPPPPPPSPLQADYQKAQDERAKNPLASKEDSDRERRLRAIARRRKGRSSTILTGALGLQKQANILRKTLLGQ